jgi:hypothetical protein
MEPAWPSRTERQHHRTRQTVGLCSPFSPSSIASFCLLPLLISIHLPAPSPARPAHCIVCFVWTSYYLAYLGASYIVSYSMICVYIRIMKIWDGQKYATKEYPERLLFDVLFLSYCKFGHVVCNVETVEFFVFFVLVGGSCFCKKKPSSSCGIFFTHTYSFLAAENAFLTVCLGFSWTFSVLHVKPDLHYAGVYLSHCLIFFRVTGAGEGDDAGRVHTGGATEPLFSCGACGQAGRLLATQ